MKRILLLIGVVVGVTVVGTAAFMNLHDVRTFLINLHDLGAYLGSPAAAPPSTNTEAEKRVLAVLDEMEQTGKTYMSVDQNKGRMLRLLTEATGAKHVVEIGTSTGYSGLWFCLALQKTGGRLTTFEIDPGRAAIARGHFKKAGVDQLVTVVEGDAHQTLAQVKEPVDVVFLDADKGGYPDYLNRLLPLVRPGGLILADNVNMSAAYLKAVTTNAALETLFWGSGRDLGVTLKKR
jgi:caffeoyl-CoA O-methyltransferase